MAKVYLEDSELTAIGNAIRNKNGESTKYLPSEMPNAIANLSGGGEGELLQMEGEVGYICGYPSYYTCEWLQDNMCKMVKPDFGPILESRGLCFHMDARFVKSITMERCEGTTINNSGVDMFRDAILDGELPVLKGPIAVGSRMFASSHLKAISRDKVEGLEQYYMDNGNISIGAQSYMFEKAYKLTDVSGLKYLGNEKGFVAGAPTSMYASCYSIRDCYVLPIVSAVSSTTAANWTAAFNTCRSLENIEWGNTYLGTSVTNTSYRITLSLAGAGYWTADPTEAMVNNYGVGLPELKVTDLESYNRLKNTEGWWTRDSAFSHMNHTNAVRILNNLPKISYGGTLTFLGTMGSGYGDPISDLTAEEIAVATAKGWTVTIS